MASHRTSSDIFFIAAGTRDVTRFYTNFGSKSRLFEAAVVDRYETFLAEHVARWSQGIANPETMSRFDFVYGFVDSFTTFFSDNRDLCSRVD